MNIKLCIHNFKTISTFEGCYHEKYENGNKLVVVEEPHHICRDRN